MACVYLCLGVGRGHISGIKSRLSCSDAFLKHASQRASQEELKLLEKKKRKKKKGRGDGGGVEKRMGKRPEKNQLL